MLVEEWRIWCLDLSMMKLRELNGSLRCSMERNESVVEAVLEGLLSRAV